MKQEAQLLLR